VSESIVIAVLNGIEISHKLFTPEMVADALAIRGYKVALITWHFFHCLSVRV